jgi:hypothetical protein
MTAADNKQLLQEAKAVLTVPELLRRMGKCPDAPNNRAIRSPIRDDDKNASFSIFAEARSGKTTARARRATATICTKFSRASIQSRRSFRLLRWLV